MLKRILLLFGPAALIGALLLPYGCGDAGTLPERILLFVSGDSRGYLEPCGCRRDQAGGLPGRATIIEEKKAPHRLVLDVGNLAPGDRPYELMKLRYLLEGMAKIGYDAVNLGKAEAQMDRETLEQSLKSAPLPYVTANVIDRQTRKPVADPYRILRRGKLRIGVTGVTHCDGREVGPGLEVRPPIEALAEVIPTLKKNCDYLVVLAFVDEDGLREIASKFHEVDCVLGGDVPQPSNSIQEINRAIVFSVMDRGKVIGQIDLKREGETYKPDGAQGIKILRDKIKPHKDMVALIGRFKDELRERRFELASAEGMERLVGIQGTADEFVGDKACTPCHQDSHKVAEHQKHAHAYQTLVINKSEYDPECLKCHTVGYGLNSGYVDAVKTPQFMHVQCENCHGRGKDHIQDMLTVLKQPTLSGAEKLARKPSTLKPVTQASCITCHDEENSENFKFATFWPTIAHGASWSNIAQFWNDRQKLLADSTAVLEIQRLLKP
jgi:hypothetical protein